MCYTFHSSNTLISSPFEKTSIEPYNNERRSQVCCYFFFIVILRDDSLSTTDVVLFLRYLHVTVIPLHVSKVTANEDVINFPRLSLHTAIVDMAPTKHVANHVCQCQLLDWINIILAYE
jgi:hypothetical protein